MHAEGHVRTVRDSPPSPGSNLPFVQVEGSTQRPFVQTPDQQSLPAWHFMRPLHGKQAPPPQFQSAQHQQTPHKLSAAPQTMGLFAAPGLFNNRQDTEHH